VVNSINNDVGDSGMQGFFVNAGDELQVWVIWKPDLRENLA
jgi:hypothetical protein